MQIGKGNVPLASRRWTPLLEGRFLSLNPWNPRRVFRLRWRRKRVCSWGRGEAKMLQEMCQWRRDADIYNLGSKCRMGMWQIIYLESEDFFDRWQSWLELISEQNRLLRNRGHVLTPFLGTCQGRWFLWREGGRFGRNQKMYRVGIGRWSSPMDQGNMLWRCWFVRSGARPMESCRWSRGRRRGSGLYENLDDSIVIFKLVYL